MASSLIARRYKLVQKLGSGQYGVVYLVDDAKDSKNKKKALKRMTLGALELNETVAPDAEAKLLSKLDHPNVLRYFDSFVEEDYFYIITEYCEGGDLEGEMTRAKKAGRRIEEAQVLTWFSQLLRALAYIHSRHILHRDIKPRNIFMNEGQVRLGDFGISRILLTTTDLATTFIGTPYYMSPEVLRHSGYNEKSDIWSVGVILYEMCALDHAFKGTSIMEVMYAILEQAPEPLPVYYSPGVLELVNQILETDPAKRLSAYELLKAPFITKHIERQNAREESASREEIDGIRRDRARKLEELRGEEAQRHLPPRERRRLQKMREADARGNQLKDVAQQNKNALLESKQRKMNALYGSNVLPVAPEHVVPRQQVNDEGRVSSAAARNRWSSDVGIGAEEHDLGVGQRGPLEVSDRTLTAGQRTGSSNASTLKARALSEHEAPGAWATTGHSGPGQRYARTDAYPFAESVHDRHYLKQYTRSDSSSGRRGGKEPPSDAVLDLNFRGLDVHHSEGRVIKLPLAELPDDPLKADTYYGAEKLEEEEEDEGGDYEGEEEEEVDAQGATVVRVPRRAADGTILSTSGAATLQGVRDQMQRALALESTGSSGPVVDDPKTDAFGPVIRDAKVQTMRQEGEKKLGRELFARVYDVYKRIHEERGRGRHPDDVEVRRLCEHAGRNYKDCFIVDQLVFLESQEKTSS